MTLKAAVVLTTIADPVLLDGYFENFRANGRLAQVRVIVIPDRQTPKAAYERCALLTKKGLPVICPTLEEQECFLRKLGLPADFIPYNSDNRRNIGYLIALEGECDFVISIDDDNFAPTRGDYFGEHAVVCGETHDCRILEASGGWFNVCALLNMEPEIETYPRGFPYFARHEKVRVAARVASATVRINGGLWTHHPDLDAMTWLNGPVKAAAFRGTSFVLDRATRSPINSQNTAVHRSVIPSYYFVKMGAIVAGMKIDRYGDIFSGYFSQACARALVVRCASDRRSRRMRGIHTTICAMLRKRWLACACWKICCRGCTKSPCAAKTTLNCIVRSLSSWNPQWRNFGDSSGTTKHVRSFTQAPA